MCMRFIGLIAVIPATMFLVVSFFVLFAAGKTEQAGLKKFAKTIAVLLWICSALVLTAGIGSVVMGGCPMMRHMKCCGMEKEMDSNKPCDCRENKCGMEEGKGKCEMMHSKMMESDAAPMPKKAK